MIVREVEWGHPDSVALRAAQRAELDARYGTPDSEPDPLRLEEFARANREENSEQKVLRRKL